MNIPLIPQQLTERTTLHGPEILKQLHRLLDLEVLIQIDLRKAQQEDNYINFELNSNNKIETDGAANTNSITHKKHTDVELGNAPYFRIGMCQISNHPPPKIKPEENIELKKIQNQKNPVNIGTQR